MGDVTFSAGALGIIGALLTALTGTIGILQRDLIKAHERQHDEDAAEIAFLRGLLSQVAGSAKEAAAAGHEAVSLGVAVARGRRM
jgi:hypothetical protein